MADLLPDSCYSRENIVVASKRHVADQLMEMRDICFFERQSTLCAVKLVIKPTDNQVVSTVQLFGENFMPLCRY